MFGRATFTFSLTIGWLVFAIPMLAAETGQAEFLQGLDAVRQGNFEEAARAFTQAIDEDDENGRYYLGRGVAHALSRKQEPARTSLDRALRLQSQDADTRLWDYVWKMMYAPRTFPGPPPYKITDYADPLIATSIEYGTPRDAATALRRQSARPNLP